MILTALRRLWQPLGVEATLALAAGLTAALLLTHPAYFEARPGVYAHLASMPWLYEEWHWGLVAGLASGFAAAGFALARFEAGREVAFFLRAVGLGIGFVFWIAFSVMLLMGGELNIGSVLTGVMALFSLRGLLAGPGEMANE